MFEDPDSFADLFRGGFPYYLLISLPILIMCSPTPVLASSEFTVNRMSQFDVQTIPFGSRSSSLNLEAKSLQSWSTSRHCVLTRLQEMTIDQFRQIRSQAGGLLVLLPENVYQLSKEEREHIFHLEQAMMAQEISIPVYFSKYDSKLSKVIDDISSHISGDGNKQRESALEEIFHSISANGYQIVVTGASHAAKKPSKLPIIQGELAPIRSSKVIESSPSDSGLPLIVIATSINSFGLITEPFANLDSAVLLTIIDLFSKIHNTPSTAPKYRLMFLLTESGRFLSFHGTKRWTEVNFDENTQSQIPEFVICLDSVATSMANNELYVHVSKPPKEGTAVADYLKSLETVAQRHNYQYELVHKKINLADSLLAWEHERFSIKRIPAFTISSLKSHREPTRTTVFDQPRSISISRVQSNAKILSESLARFIFGINGESEVFAGSSSVTENQVESWLHMKSLTLNNDIKNAFEKYLKNVQVTYDKVSGKDDEFLLYDSSNGVLNVYNVKPAVFDLFLTFLIVAYLAGIYFAIIYFPHLYNTICKFSLSTATNNINSSNTMNGTSKLKSL